MAHLWGEQLAGLVTQQPSALFDAQVHELLAEMRMDEWEAGTEAAAAQLNAALARLEAEPLPEADDAAHRSLEALRLEDPAAWSGCWNPECVLRFYTSRVLEDPRWHYHTPVCLYLRIWQSLRFGSVCTLYEAAHSRLQTSRTMVDRSVYLSF